MLIIGGTGKIGRELVKRYSRTEEVFFTYHKNYELAEKLQEKFSARAVKLDLRNINENFFEQIGKHEKVIFTAGIFKRIKNLAKESVDELVDTNLKGPVYLAFKFIDTGTKNMVFITDISGEVPYPTFPLNSITSAGIFMLIRTLARRFSPEVLINGIAINALSPPFPEYVKKLPMQRLPETRELIKTLDFLFYENSYITGQILKLDGGRSLL